MKTFIILTILFCTKAIYAQSTVNKVTAIKAYVNSVYNNQTLTTKRCSHSDFENAITDGIEILKGYYEDGQLVSILHSQDISPATQIFYRFYLQNNKIVSYRIVSQIAVFDEHTQTFNREKWNIEYDVNIYLENKNVLEVTTKGSYTFSLINELAIAKNSFEIYKKMLQKK